MKTRILMLICLAVALTAIGCDKTTEAAAGAEAEAEAPAAKEAAEAEEAPAEEAPAEEAAAKEEAAEKLEPVEVAAAGTKFEPAVQAEQLPAGAWYCDMGTVHWAGTDKPDDGKCPECGMELKQYDPEALAAQKEKAVEAKPAADDGHAHDGEGHGDHAHGEGDDHAH